MPIISQDLANQIAFKLTEKSRIAADNLHVVFRELATKIYEDQTPQEIKNTFKKFPDWFEIRTQVVLNSHGFNWECVSTTRPVITNAYGKCHIKLTQALADKLSAAQSKWQKAKGKYEQLKKETKLALLALKTHKNIKEEFPEAAPMLPPPMSNALVVNFDSLKRKLRIQSDEKEVKIELEEIED